MFSDTQSVEGCENNYNIGFLVWIKMAWTNSLSGPRKLDVKLIKRDQEDE